MEVKVLREYRLPYPATFEEVLATIAHNDFRVLHSDPAKGRIIADTGTFWNDSGLLDIWISPGEGDGTWVSAKAEPYWVYSRDRMERQVNVFFSWMDHRVGMRGRQLADSIGMARQGRPMAALAYHQPVDLEPKELKRPRAAAIVVLGLIGVVIVLLPILAQESVVGVMWYMILSAPVLMGCVLALAGSFRYAGWFLTCCAVFVTVLYFIAGGAIGLFLGLCFVPFTLKAAARAFRAALIREHWDGIRSGSDRNPLDIEMERR